MYECSVCICVHTFACVGLQSNRKGVLEWLNQNTSQPLWSEQQPLQESVFEFLLPSRLCLQHRLIFCSSSFPSTGRNLQLCTYPSCLTPLLSLCFGGNLNMDFSLQPLLILPRCKDIGLETLFYYFLLHLLYLKKLQKLKINTEWE